jgi:hypothetical protein
VPAVLCNFLSFAIKRREGKGMLKQRLSLLVAPGYSPLQGPQGKETTLRIGRPRPIRQELGEIGCRGRCRPFHHCDAAECIDKITWYAALGVKEIACLMNFGTPDAAAVGRSMRLFAELVMPRLGR